MPSSKLNRTDEFTSGDLVVLWSGGDYDYRAISKDDFVKALNEVLQTGKPNTQYEGPSANAFTVRIDSGRGDVHLILTPTANFASGAITLPSSPLDKQLVIVNCTTTITGLSVFAGVGDSVVGQPTTLAANAFFTMKYDLLLKRWYRVE